MKRSVWVVITAMLLSSVLSFVQAAQVGDVIANTAQIAYTIDGEDKNATTNEVNLSIVQTPATIELMTLDLKGAGETIQPTTYEGPGGTTPMPPAIWPDGTPISLPSDLNLSGTSQYGPQDLVVIRLTDIDQNTDIDTQQIIDVNVTNPRTGEIETLHLMETGPNTGVFVGYTFTEPCDAEYAATLAATPEIRNGAVCVAPGDTIVVEYVDNGSLKRIDAEAAIREEQFALLVTKSQSKDVASIGEYLKYTLTVENIGKRDYRDVLVEDKLPDGVKYVPKSFKVEGTSVIPQLSPDGKILSYTLPLLRRKEKITLTYVAVIGAGTVDNEAVNTVWASAPGAGKSNIAKTTLKVEEELWRSKGFILGQVTEADVPCEENTTKGVAKSDAIPGSSVIGLDGKPHPVPGCGVEGVKLYMEDGRYVVTDKNGRYHFIDVANGTHVVQIDEESIKGRYTIEQCERNTRFAGKARSQFVEVHHGGLNRADFCLRRIPGLTGRSLLDVRIVKRAADTVSVRLRTNATMELIDPEVFLSLSDGLAYVKGSATTEEEPVDQEGILVVKMGGAKEATLRFRVIDNIIPDKEIRAILYYDTRLSRDQHSDIASVMFTTIKGQAVIDKITRESDAVSSETVGGKTPAGEGDYNWTKPTHQSVMPQYTPEEVDALGNDSAIVWPPQGWIPDIPSTRVAILYPKGHTVELRLNGHKVSMLNYEGLFRGTKGMRIMHFKGVDLSEGQNIFTAVIKKGDTVIKRISRRVFVESRAPSTITFLPEYSWLYADGKHEPIIAVKLIGPSGHPLRGGMVGSFTTDGAHAPAQTSNDKGTYTVDSEGIAYVRLRPTAIAGEARLTFKLNGNLYQTIRVRLKPYLRPWIVVGFAEGTIGYNILSGNNEGLDHQGVEEGLYVDGRLAFFAKGRIKGDWLLTMAYDSGREEGDRELFDSIDSSAYYTIYQDATHQENEAPSTKKLYLKLEKNTWQLLFGDYRTGIEGGEFDSYHRSFTGGRIAYQGTNIETVVFAAETDRLHYREDFPADGTAGYYTLHHLPVEEGSETVTIEVRDRHRSEIILQSRIMERWREYTIDYDTGQIYFKEPVLSTDAEFNPRYIVVRYDVEETDSTTHHYTYGGRMTFSDDSGKLHAGGTFVTEDYGGGENRLYGMDMRYQTGDHSQLSAEYAHTRNEYEGNVTRGDAYKIEWYYNDTNQSLRAYWRYQESAFGLGTLAPELTGTRKSGLDIRRRLTTYWSLNGTFYQNRRYDTNGTYEDEIVFSPTVTYQDSNWSASIGYRYANNTFTPATHQMTMKLTRLLLERKLKLSLSHDQSLFENEDEEFPTRTTLGADYKVDKNTSVFGQVERSDSDGTVTWRSRMGAAYKPWKDGELRISRLFDHDGQGWQGYDTIGLTQRWKQGEKWAFEVGYEKGIAEYNSTQDNFDAIHAGAKVTHKRYEADAHVGYRTAGDEKKLNIDLGLYVRKDKDLGLATGLGWHTEWDDITLHRDVDARLAFAWRPDNGPWIVLDRLDYTDQYDITETDEVRTRKLVNNFAANYHPDSHWEIGVQYGLKYILDQIDGMDYDGWVDLLGLDTLYHLNNTWALGVQGSVLHAYGANNMDYSGGAYVATTPWENAMLTLGYNIAGFEDEDFSLQNYRHKGPYIQIKMKFDQENIRDIVKGVAQ